MKKIRNTLKAFKRVFTNLTSLLKLSMEANSFLTSGYYLSAGIAAVFPIITSYFYKLLVDNAVASQGAVSIPVVLVSVLGGYYVVTITHSFIRWGLGSTYFDYLLRYALQNKINFEFYKKVSALDIAHLENPDTEDLIQKAKDTMTWQLPNFLRQFSYVFANLIAYTTAFFLLIPYGFAIPLLLSLSALPRLLFRMRFGKIVWSIYGAETPEARKMWYIGWLLSNKTAIQESRIFQSTKSLLSRFKEVQEHLYKEYKKPIVKYIKILVLPDFLEVGITFLFALIKLPAVLSGEMSVGDYTFFIALLSRFVDSASGIVLEFGEMYADNLYVEHYFDVLSLPKLVEESPGARSLPLTGKAPKIEFRDVSFTYPGTSKRVLSHISFTINPEENVALVGANGAGKTTIVKLLCRFYDATEGEILIDGINIKEVKLSDWYKHIGTLFQEFIRYDFTAKENILLGNPEVIDEDKVRAAAKKSGADEFINDLPNGYDQLLGRQFKGGTELSIGQWQKLAIARAFYENAPLLILDEPTSAIDAETEFKIFNNLHKFYKDKSLLFISHRFSSVRMADKIIVVSKGKIEEQGTHKELIEMQSTYAKLYTLQAQAYQ